MLRYSAILALILLCANCKAEHKEVVKHPNIVIFLVDDLGATDLGCYGSTFYETPNIDRLAKSGIRFAQAYSASPVGAPTRAGFLTGKYPTRFNITDWIPGRQSAMVEPSNKLVLKEFNHNLPLSEKTLAEALKEAGYSTFFAGKWNLGEKEEFYPENQGFDINKGGWSAGTANFSKGFFSPYKNPKLSDGPHGEYLTDRLGNESVHFLESVGDNPFLLLLSFYGVHVPMMAKPDLVEKYRHKRDSLAYPDYERYNRDAAWMEKAGTGSWRERLIQDNPLYASMVESVDENVGKVISKLKEMGLDKNTIILFLSDNGGLATAESSPTSNLPLRAGKGWLYEGGIRIPMLLSWPDSINAGQSFDEAVTTTDLYPTLLNLAQIPINKNLKLDGTSIDTHTHTHTHTHFWNYPHYSSQGGSPCGAIREGNMKLIEFFEDMHCELYDLDKDPGETTDLSASMPEKVKELKTKLHQWRESVKAKMPAVNPNYDPNYRGQRL